MFEQSLVTSGDGVRRGWAFGVSLVAQCALTGALVALPLLFTYELPLQTLRQALFLASPPPPSPPPPPQAKIEPRVRPRRFDEILKQPHRIPKKVALVEDAAPRVALSAAPAGVEDGVLGGIASTPNLLPFLKPTFSKPILVGGRVQAARLLNQVQPVFPPEALEQNISGRVLLRAIIGKDGAIRQLELLSGHPLLATAAIDAVEQWRYKPTVLNGKAVEVETNIEVNFSIVAPPEPEDDKKKRRRRR